jgi:hypothetical protein
MNQYSNWVDSCPVTAFVSPDPPHCDYQHYDTTAATFVEFKSKHSRMPSVEASPEEHQMNSYVDSLLNDAVESKPHQCQMPLKDATN